MDLWNFSKFFQKCCLNCKKPPELSIFISCEMKRKQGLFNYVILTLTGTMFEDTGGPRLTRFLGLNRVT